MDNFEKFYHIIQTGSQAGGSSSGAGAPVLFDRFFAAADAAASSEKSVPGASGAPSQGGLLSLAAAGCPTIYEHSPIEFRPSPYLLVLRTDCGRCRVSCGRLREILAEDRFLLADLGHALRLMPLSARWSFRIYLVSGAREPAFLSALHAAPLLPGNTVFTDIDFSELDQAVLLRFPVAPDEMASSRDPAGSCGEVSGFAVHRILTDLLCRSLETGDTGPAREEIHVPRASAADGAPPVPHYLRSMHEAIHSDFSLVFSLAQFEQELGINRFRLCREYTAAFGVSPLKDFHHVRITAARRLLTASKLQIQEIGGQCGYENVNLFLYHFRKETGMTPKEYRAANPAFFTY